MGGGVLKTFLGSKNRRGRASGFLPWIRQWIGSNTGKNEILAPERNFKWQKDKVRSLGLLFSSDPTNEATIKETNKLFYSLFWNGKNDKIKLDIMIKNYPDGGLKMVDVESFNKALKVTWVKNAWTKTIGVSGIFFFYFHLGKLGYGLSFNGNLNKIKFNQLLKHKRQLFEGNSTNLVGDQL